MKDCYGQRVSSHDNEDQSRSLNSIGKLELLRDSVHHRPCRTRHSPFRTARPRIHTQNRASHRRIFGKPRPDSLRTDKQQCCHQFRPAERRSGQTARAVRRACTMRVRRAKRLPDPLPASSTRMCAECMHQRRTCRYRLVTEVSRELWNEPTARRDMRLTSAGTAATFNTTPPGAQPANSEVAAGLLRARHEPVVCRAFKLQRRAQPPAPGGRL